MISVFLNPSPIFKSGKIFKKRWSRDTSLDLTTQYLYVTCTSTIMQLIPPPPHPRIKFCITLSISPGYYSRPREIENNGCLPFTWANRSVYGLGKWYAKFRTGKFSSGIAFTICTDQFHLTENGREGLKLVSRWLRGNGTRISVWNISSGKTGLPFQMFRCSRKFSVGKTQKVVFHLLSNRISRKILVNGKQPIFMQNFWEQTRCIIGDG